MHITLIAGARPNFMKIASVIEAIHEAQATGQSVDYRLVHTGQHFDEQMSASFFADLHIPEPHVNLECGGGTQAQQTANIMVRFEADLHQHPTDLVLVVGDVTSTMACAIVAKKLGIKVAHVEAGIRSGDRLMPEEINRLVTDSITDFFFTTTQAASDELKRSGMNPGHIFLVGNTMIDTLIRNQSRLVAPACYAQQNLAPQQYIVLTLHRPSNVDDVDQLASILQTIDQHTNGLPVLFPVHPRTQKIIENINLTFKHIHFTAPLRYLEFNYLVANSKAVITDSGGITEETTFLGIPCMTLRNSTERPETCTLGTNELLGTDARALKPALLKLFAGNWKKGSIPPLWDGQTGNRIIHHLLKELLTPINVVS
jgi:UDP-N-acetylglucosamine 2-epimerase (non-hydrolysing)